MSNRYDLSRRKALLGLGTIGVASAGAGVGTSAFFSDDEEFSDNQLTAGELDLRVQAEVYEYQGQANDGGQSFSGTVNGGDKVKQELTDIKPGDYSWGRFCFSVVDNPAYLWAGGELTSNREDPDDPESETGELADAIEGCLFYTTPENYDPENYGRPTVTGAPGTVILEGSLRHILEELQEGVKLDASDAEGRQAFPEDPEPSFSNSDRCLGFWWEVPTDVGNEIQTDGLTFDLSFVAEQERHNDGNDNPFDGDPPDE